VKRSRGVQLALLAMAVVALMASPAGARAACPNADQAVSSGTTPAMVEMAKHAVTCLVNQERARYRLGPVYVDARLDLAAQQHNDEMVDRSFFDSVDPDGMGPGARVVADGYGWGSVAENIARGQGSPRQVVGAWMLSTANCRNVLSPDVVQTGVGLTALPGGGASEWTEVLARPSFLEPPSTHVRPARGCPHRPGPDRAGPGNDGSGAFPVASPHLSVGVAVRRSGDVQVVARAFGSRVVVGGISRGPAGRFISVTVTRFGGRTRTMVVTAASGDFTANLAIPARRRGRRSGRRVVVIVRVGGRARLKPSLAGGVGRVG